MKRRRPRGHVQRPTVAQELRAAGIGAPLDRQWRLVVGRDPPIDAFSSESMDSDSSSGDELDDMSLDDDNLGAMRLGIGVGETSFSIHQYPNQPVRDGATQDHRNRDLDDRVPGEDGLIRNKEGVIVGGRVAFSREWLDEIRARLHAMDNNDSYRFLVILSGALGVPIASLLDQGDMQRRERESRLAMDAQRFWLENYYMSASDRQKLIDRGLETVTALETTLIHGSRAIQEVKSWADAIEPLVSTAAGALNYVGARAGLLIPYILLIVDDKIGHMVAGGLSYAEWVADILEATRPLFIPRIDAPDLLTAASGHARGWLDYIIAQLRTPRLSKDQVSPLLCKYLLVRDVFVDTLPELRADDLPPSMWADYMPPVVMERAAENVASSAHDMTEILTRSRASRVDIDHDITNFFNLSLNLSTLPMDVGDVDRLFDDIDESTLNLFTRFFGSMLKTAEEPESSVTTFHNVIMRKSGETIADPFATNVLNATFLHSFGKISLPEDGSRLFASSSKVDVKTTHQVKIVQKERPSRQPISLTLISKDASGSSTTKRIHTTDNGHAFPRRDHKEKRADMVEVSADDINKHGLLEFFKVLQHYSDMKYKKVAKWIINDDGQLRNSLIQRGRLFCTNFIETLKSAKFESMITIYMILITGHTHVQHTSSIRRLLGLRGDPMPPVRTDAERDKNIEWLETVGNQMKVNTEPHLIPISMPDRDTSKEPPSFLPFSLTEVLAACRHRHRANQLTGDQWMTSTSWFRLLCDMYYVTRVYIPLRVSYTRNYIIETQRRIQKAHNQVMRMLTSAHDVTDLDATRVLYLPSREWEGGALMTGHHRLDPSIVYGLTDAYQIMQQYFPALSDVPLPVLMTEAARAVGLTACFATLAAVRMSKVPQRNPKRYMTKMQYTNYDRQLSDAAKPLKRFFVERRGTEVADPVTHKFTGWKFGVRA